MADFCFKYGRIRHEEVICSEVKMFLFGLKYPWDAYGMWMHAKGNLISFQ